ncbi:MAG: type I methionyl aminopeptidase [Clostridiales bacterium]|nr:type I methionyl aminopeptidase [Clostridiales bacterium]
MISLKNPDQIAKMRVAGALLYEVLQQLREMVKPGVSTAELDARAEELIRKGHAIPSFLNYEGYPASICASVDDAVVHGIPSKKQVLKEGQIISIDCGLILDGWQADSAFTVGVGEISPEAQHLIDVTEQCFWEGARQAVAGNRLGDLGHAVQTLAEANGFGVVRDLTGHGIGREMHEDPAVYNFGTPGRGLRMRKGMTIAIEPMISAGDWRVTVDDDQWCYRTRDRSLCSHYEHTIAINEEGLPEILTLPGFVWEQKED